MPQHLLGQLAEWEEVNSHPQGQWLCRQEMWGAGSVQRTSEAHMSSAIQRERQNRGIGGHFPRHGARCELGFPAARPGAVHPHSTHRAEEEPGAAGTQGVRLEDARPKGRVLSPAALPTSSATRSPHWMSRSSTS